MVTKVDQTGHKVRNTLSVRPEDVNGALPATALGSGLVSEEGTCFLGGTGGSGGDGVVRAGSDDCAVLCRS